MVSVIVPVYNVEQYLNRCLDSIIEQDYRDLEIIIVDDGSTDDSGTICDKYASKDNRIHVFHRDNVGAALARSFALNIATGEYILMVDSDDWIDKTMISTMLSKAEEKDADVIWCDVNIQFPHGSDICKIVYSDDASEMLKMTYTGINPGWFWNKLIRRHLLTDLFVYSDSIFEDLFFTTQLLHKNPRMAYVPAPLYVYNRTNIQALTNGSDISIKGIPNILHCYDYLVSHNSWENYRESFFNLIIRTKIEFISHNRISEAQSFFPLAHKDINTYPIKKPYSFVYWIGLNLGLFGVLILTIYKKLHSNRRLCFL